MSSKLRVAELETLFTANVDQIEDADRKINNTKTKIEKNPIKVGADAKGALGSMDRVEQAAKRLVSKDTALVINANIDRADKNLDRTQKRLDYLRSVETTMDVKADIARAEASLQRIQRQKDALVKSRESMVVDVADEGAKQKLQDVADFAGESGKRGGEDMGNSLVSALASIPIAGAIAGIAYVAARAVREGFEEGLQIEVRQDRLQALTGISEADAMRLGHIAAQAYSNTFGESIEANMDATRLALQFRLIDPTDATRDSQIVIEGLLGISDVLNQDVSRAAQAVTTLLKTGMAKNASEALDIIAAGAREGADRGEDLLDTLIEYPSVLTKLGLTGSEMLGLINQGLRAGARNSDFAADALKEFQIRATDASKASAAGFERLGLDAETMTAKIAAGGAGAREGLQEVLDKLREMTDPVQRNAAAVELFGTKAEDLGDALFEMDLTTAVDQLNGVTGAADRMFDTLSDNDATRVKRAQRNIEVAAQGIQGALAAAFSEPVGEFADWVSQNRGPVLQFFLDLANGAIDFGVSMVESTANATEGIGQFVGGPLAILTESLAGLLRITGQGDAADDLDRLAKGMHSFQKEAEAGADVMRTEWVGALEDARGRLNAFGEGAVQMGYLNDASLRLADAINAVGDGSSTLELQTRAAVDALKAEIQAASDAGDSQEALKDRYDVATQALMDQLIAAGLTEQQAKDLIATYNGTPDIITTAVQLTGTDAAERALDELTRDRIASIKAQISASYGPAGNIGGTVIQGHGGVVEFMARGGLTPMQPVAQVVPPNTWRVVGDRSDVSESYIPIDGSARSMAILFETMRRMGVAPMGDGGLTGGEPYRLDDATITGVLEIGGDGLARLVDGRIRVASESRQTSLRAGRRSGG
ncbi:phage tail tape measure protein [Microbacterium sp.]|uniref:phage tail tape measure protein n=1 Tax=Microbacterium sp. TaxID=51671 RepID=UPI003F71AA63